MHLHRRTLQDSMKFRNLCLFILLFSHPIFSSTIKVINGRIKPSMGKSVTRWIAVGSINSQITRFREILRMSGVLAEVEDTDQWVAPSGTIVVLLGDVIESTANGEDTLAILDLVHRMTHESVVAGSIVVPLMGDQELRAIGNRLINLSPHIESSRRFKSVEQLLSWLESWKVVVEYDAILFSHAGFHENFAGTNLNLPNGAKDIVLRVHQPREYKDLKTLQYLGLVSGSDFLLDGSSTSCSMLEKRLKKANLQALIVGHHETGERFAMKCDGILYSASSDFSKSVGYVTWSENKGVEVVERDVETEEAITRISLGKCQRSRFRISDECPEEFQDDVHPSALARVEEEEKQLTLSHRVDSETRIIAVGDVHGDYEHFVQVLKMARVIDDELNWSAGSNVVLVQTGDVMDRGPDPPKIYQLLFALKFQAQAQGSEVVMLLGNHEHWNLMGDFRYVNSIEIRAYGSQQQRAAQVLPSGAFGSYLTSLPIARKIGATVFVHGGIHPGWAAVGIEEMNQLARNYYLTKDPKYAAVFGPEGPLNYRVFSSPSYTDEQVCPHIEESLKILDAKHMVVGHTSTGGEVFSRCGGKYFVIDVGIWYSVLRSGHTSHLAALEIRSSRISAIYPNREELLYPVEGSQALSDS